MKKSLSLTVGAALLALLSACGSKKNTVAPGMVVISGQIVGRDSLSPTTVVANFQNPFDHGGSSPVARIDPADGSFRVEYEMPYPQTINIRCGNRFIMFHAAPGDNIGVRVDASQTDSEDWGKVVKYSGNGAELNTRFTPALNRFNAMHSWFDNTLSPEDFLKTAGDHLQMCRDSLTAYARREGLSREEVRLLDAEIVNGVIYRAAAWRDDEPQTETMRRLFTEMIDIHDSCLASAELYGNNVLACMMRCLVDPALLEEDPAAFMLQFIQTMQGQPAGLTRDIMVYATFAELSMAFPDLLATFATEARALLDSGYARACFDLLTIPADLEFEPLPLSGISSINAEGKTEPLPQVDMFEYLAGKHSGKVIYIDISAHWCGPCIAEIPHMKRIEKSLAGEDVAIVALWLESDLDATVRLMREHGLVGENYFFTTDASRLFGGHYRVDGFPTYMLIDRTGTLVNSRAGRPSEEKTIGQIRELLQ